MGLGLFPQATHSLPDPDKRLAAMSFDQYFDNAGKQSHRSQASDDWYQIVEEALHAADEAAYLHRQQLENLGLMKPLPIIPEDDADDMLELSNLLQTNDQLCRDLNIAHENGASRRSSSVYSTDFDSPLSRESVDLDAWAANVWFTGQKTMSSLRSKPFARPSSFTSSALSERSLSTGSSVPAARSQSTGSSVYSANTSVDSYESSLRDICMHSRKTSKNSITPLSRVQSAKSANISYFDFDDEEEEEEKEVMLARPESSAGTYVKYLRKKALSLRIATSNIVQTQARLSAPAKNRLSLSTWSLRPLSLHRISMFSLNSDNEFENQLMTGAAESAKAKRLLGLR